MPDLADRLREERERLGFSQEALGEACGVSGRSQRNYELGERQPDAGYLALFAQVGGDVLYVVTAQRSRPLSPEEQLPRVEQEWLALYRNSTAEVRAALKAAGDELAKPARKGGKAA